MVDDVMGMRRIRVPDQWGETLLARWALSVSLIDNNLIPSATCRGYEDLGFGYDMDILIIDVASSSWLRIDELTEKRENWLTLFVLAIGVPRSLSRHKLL